MIQQGMEVSEIRCTYVVLVVIVHKVVISEYRGLHASIWNNLEGGRKKKILGEDDKYQYKL